MSTKLTLTVDKSIVERAKSYAKNTGRGLSKIMENFLPTLMQETSVNELSQNLKTIVGVVSSPADFAHKETLRSAFEKKYLS